MQIRHKAGENDKMSQKKINNNHPKKKRKRKNTWITVLLAIVLAVLLLALWKVSAGREGADKPENEGEQETEQERLELPYTLEGGKIEVKSLFQYTGMNPDCNDEYGDDIASLEVTNLSSEHLAKAEFTVKLENGRDILFEISDVPAGKTIWVYEKDNSTYDGTEACVSIQCESSFEEATSLMEDQLTIEVQDAEVTLTNISGEELTNLDVYCHCLFEEAFFGGLTYKYPVANIPIGESVTIQAEECYLGQASVVRVSRDD